jgi:hypothetical protein
MPCKVLAIHPDERKVAYIQSLLRVGFDSDRFWEFCVAKSDSTNGGYHCCIGWIYRKRQVNYWLLLPILEERKWLLSMLKFNI